MKTFAIIENGKVINRARASEALAENWIEADVEIGWLWDGETFSPPPAPDIEASKTRAVAQVDADVDAIYAAVVGNRGLEYEAAEREATAYAAAGYTGTAGPMVKSWAIAKDWSDEEAADDILAQASNWRGVMAAIRTQRLASKEAIRSATNRSEFDAALSAWNSFVAQVRSNLGI